MAHLMMVGASSSRLYNTEWQDEGYRRSDSSLFQHTNLAFTRSEPGTSYVEVRLDKLQHGSILSQTVV
jgi:hypothetical protein